MQKQELPSWVKPGASFQIEYPDGAARIHIRAIVDGRAVVREWSRHKRRWDYRVEHPAFFHVWAEQLRNRRQTRIF